MRWRSCKVVEAVEAWKNENMSLLYCKSLFKYHQVHVQDSLQHSMHAWVQSPQGFPHQLQRAGFISQMYSQQMGSSPQMAKHPPPDLHIKLGMYDVLRKRDKGFY